jgi:flagellar biosynthesis/type III secretory pathway protein FliH
MTEHEEARRLAKAEERVAEMLYEESYTPEERDEAIQELHDAIAAALSDKEVQREEAVGEARRSLARAETERKRAVEAEHELESLRGQVESLENAYNQGWTLGYEAALENQDNPGPLPNHGEFE